MVWGAPHKTRRPSRRTFLCYENVVPDKVESLSDGLGLGLCPDRGWDISVALKGEL